MKKSAFILISAAMLLLSCGRRNDPSLSVVSADVQEDSCLSVVPDGYDLFLPLQDAERRMSAELFAGQNDTLLSKLLPDGSAASSINVFLLKGKGKTVLFDAGLGAAQGGLLLQKLDSLKISPNQVTDICISHFHGDHIGGLLDADGKAQFPIATLYLPKEECEVWLNGVLKQNNAQVKLMMSQYKDRIVQFAAGDTILEDIVTVAAHGHTPGHVLYDLGSVLIVGDLMHAVELQLMHPEFSARYDTDPKQAADTRKSVLEQAANQRRILTGMHFPAPFFERF